MNTVSAAINDEVQRASAFVRPLFGEIGKIVVGQNYLVERLAIGLRPTATSCWKACPAWPKPCPSRSLAACLNVKFLPLQFTPDLLPADLIGTQILYNPRPARSHPGAGRSSPTWSWPTKSTALRPRCKARSWSRCRKKTGHHRDQTFKLEGSRFLVLATQNPIEQEGTYPLPGGAGGPVHVEAEIVYPSREEERQIWT